MDLNDITGKIVNVAYEIHQGLGPGLFESVYEMILFDQLTEAGFRVNRQVTFPVYYHTKKYQTGFRVDLLVNSAVIVEVKSVESLQPVHYKQLLTYLRLMNIKLGLLINFNEEYIKNGLRRVVNQL